MTDDVRQPETYTHGHSPAVVQHHAKRTAAEAAAFLRPHLRPGLRLLDLGCGPGSITLGLAEMVAPGEVVGLDLSAETIDGARREAAVKGVTNVQFRVGSLYDLPDREGSFDVVYAHQVFQHLAQPHEALRQALRVLAPGGLVAVRDVDWGTVAYWPADPAIDQFLTVYQEVSRRNGGEPHMGRRLRAVLRAAGVTDLRITAMVWVYATPDQTHEWGDAYAKRVVESAFARHAVDFGYVTRTDLERMATAFRTWAAHPDAFWAFTQTEALGRKP